VELGGGEATEAREAKAATVGMEEGDIGFRAVPMAVQVAQEAREETGVMAALEETGA
jgi:hypothetical protein